MAVTKAYVDVVATGMSVCSARPSNPIIGDCYIDFNSMTMHTWNGFKWVQMGMDTGTIKEVLIPTQEQLDKHPALKQSWEEYLVIKRLLGL